LNLLALLGALGISAFLAEELAEELAESERPSSPRFSAALKISVFDSKQNVEFCKGYVLGARLSVSTFWAHRYNIASKRGPGWKKRGMERMGKTGTKVSDLSTIAIRK
jgi:hypothetical protein